MDMSKVLDGPAVGIETVDAWLRAEVFTWPSFIQLLMLLAIILAAYLTQRVSTSPVERFIGRAKQFGFLDKPMQGLQPLIVPFVAMAMVWLTVLAFVQFDYTTGLLQAAGNLLTAWVVIRLLSTLLKQSPWSSLIAATIWTVAALAILGWLNPLLGFLDSAALQAGDVRISALGILNSLLILAAFLIVSQLLLRLVDDRMRAMSAVTPAARVLLVKLLRIVFITLAVVVSLTSVGIDLSAVAIFSGAVGIGVGFGLQKVISNLFSGILLLLDRSLKPGDVIEVGDAYGWIDKMGARYVTVATRDGKEFLIPNEDIITQPVINWSHSDKAVRIKIGVGISYGSDVRKAMDLMVQAATDQSRVIKDAGHEPQARLTEFADSSVNLELRVWVLDPERGMVNIASDIRLAIWDLFHEAGIEFPFPQQDVHVASAVGLEAVLDKYLKGR